MAHPDAKLLKLGTEFEAAVVNYHRDTAELDAQSGKLTPHEINLRFEQICAQLDAPRAAIAAARARTLAGLQVKARAAAWPYGADQAIDGFPVLDDSIVESIIRDLLLITGPWVCGGVEQKGRGRLVPIQLRTHGAIDRYGPKGSRGRMHAELTAQQRLTAAAG